MPIVIAYDTALVAIPERETIIRALDDCASGARGAPRRAAPRARRPGAGRPRLAEPAPAQTIEQRVSG